jgi:hypothetical protein
VSVGARDADADLAGLPVRAVTPGEAARSAPLFSVCSLVTDAAQYRRMVESFLVHGFGPDRAEYLYADNRAGNAADGYAGLGQLIAAARGTYVICCHQDVEAVDDGADKLVALLAELDARDPSWALAANAGAAEGRSPRRISDNIGGPDQSVGPFPAAVDAVDENFIVLRRAALLAPSRDLTGYHLYGLDLCLQARLRGWSAYVIDFHLRHHGRGIVDATYFDCAEALEARYSGALARRRIPTLFRPVYLTCAPSVDLLWRYRRWVRRWRWMRRTAAGRATAPERRRRA